MEAGTITASTIVVETHAACPADLPLVDPALTELSSAAVPSSEVSVAGEGSSQAATASVCSVPRDPEEAWLDNLRRCERRIGYEFRDRALAREALTHASGAEHRLASNERLEFLGDAILGAVVCELLFERYPNYLEGDLTKIKSAVVSRQSCAKISEALGLQEFLIVGKGVAASPSIPPSLLADVFESLVAAIYLDGGNEASRKFIEELLGPEIELAAMGELGGNFKSLLQQYAQREFSITPTYQLLDEKGPDHRKCFKMAAQIGSNLYPPAWGRNKKEAEQRAACNALAELNGEPAQFPSD
jgi:ribonuclease III